MTLLAGRAVPEALAHQVPLMTSAPEPTPLRPSILQPYTSLVILEITTGDIRRAYEVTLDYLRSAAQGRRRGQTIVVADGFGDDVGGDPTVDGLVDDVNGFVYRRESQPKWVKEGNFTDVSYELAIIVRRRRLIGVHADGALRESLGRWLNRDPRPPVARVRAKYLQGALLRGEARGLWLRSTQSGRTNRPDSKVITGRRLQDALNPFEYGFLAMGSGRAELPADPARLALSGAVGTTPRRALFWNKQSPDFETFIRVASDALGMVDAEISEGSGLDQPFPTLAAETEDLSQVYGAYEVTTLSPSELQGDPVSTDEALEAAQTLEAATLIVIGDTSSPNFSLDVGFDGAIAGRLRVRLVQSTTGFRYDIGFQENPTNSDQARQILDALGYEGILHAYYSSGHSTDGSAVWTNEIRLAPFPNWNWLQFQSGAVDIRQEKPSEKSAQDIHDAIGMEDDSSLFGWVLDKYSDGWLTCDDGTGEVADFIHVSTSGTLSLIHVKAARSRSASRRAAAAPYEGVAGQAEKNAIYLDPKVLRNRLENAPVPSPATWTDGERVETRDEFLDALDCRSAVDKTVVVIVQPHLRRDIYMAIRADESRVTEDLLRVRLLDTLLNATRAAIVGYGAELEVIGSEN